MLNIIYKEFKLAAHPTLFIFMFMGILLLIPGYPTFILFGFGCLGVFISLYFARETNDLYYSALLPLKKSSVVSGKLWVAVFSQAIQLVIAIPFALFNMHYFAKHHTTGMPANIAYFGFGLMAYGLFNLIFYTQFFKTAITQVDHLFSQSSLRCLLAY